MHNVAPWENTISNIKRHPLEDDMNYGHPINASQNPDLICRLYRANKSNAQQDAVSSQPVFLNISFSTPRNIPAGWSSAKSSPWRPHLSPTTMRPNKTAVRSTRSALPLKDINAAPGDSANVPNAMIGSDDYRMERLERMKQLYLEKQVVWEEEVASLYELSKGRVPLGFTKNDYAMARQVCSCCGLILQKLLERLEEKSAISTKARPRVTLNKS
ncbi:hypothetical protein PSACC_03584 [Paramicrosporidium saccamoebae]|uniref:Uncharacterized protein n=1 Tax=Paramicrosporidium saccamoebae TaxID=1246581 RepID=A0A2H9TFP3_9FUNG|nr:hypothetical protein PSACC_03584 [Paramicrosporidium saccamoebae]